jgi:uncharacterized Zn finger protein (UPF0148 family)
MTLIIKELFRVFCPICDWTRTYSSYNEIPQDIKDGKCPSCGGDVEGYSKVWKARKEEIHAKIRNKA